MYNSVGDKEIVNLDHSRFSHCGVSHTTKTINQQIEGKGNKKLNSSFNSRNFKNKCT